MRICRAFMIALVAMTAAPASSLAQSQSGEVKTLTIGPAKLGSYTMTVQARSDSPNVFLDLTRRKGNTTQSHSYTLRGQLALSGADDDSSATLVADLGKSGGGILDFEALTGAFTDPVPLECDGAEGSIRRGKVSGSLRLKVDEQGFGTLRIRQADATYGRRATYGCVNAPTTQGTYLQASKRVGSNHYFLDAEQIGQRVAIIYTLRRPRQTHQLIVGARTRALTVGENFTKGRLRAVGSFLRGVASVSGGRLSGNLAGAFDFVGRRSFPSTRDVSLGRN
jgi:hypothetical protein